MNKNKIQRAKRVLVVIFSCALCFVLQWATHTYLRSKDARFVSPVNEENTLIRLQNVHEIDAPVLFIGSSLTERLLPRKSSASVAMSHSSFVYVNEFMKTCYQYRPGTVYVLETNNMFAGRNVELLARTSQWDFDFFRNSSHFSFEAKPTNLFVSFLFYLLEHKKIETEEWYDMPPMPIANMQDVPDITERQKEQWSHLIRGIKELQALGGRICFVNHPCKVTPECYLQGYRNGCILAKYLGIPVLNYNSSDWVERFDFSDPTHLRSRHKNTVMYMNTVARSASAIAVD